MVFTNLHNCRVVHENANRCAHVFFCFRISTVTDVTGRRMLKAASHNRISVLVVNLIEEFLHKNKELRVKLVKRIYTKNQGDMKNIPNEILQKIKGDHINGVEEHDKETVLQRRDEDYSTPCR